MMEDVSDSVDGVADVRFVGEYGGGSDCCEASLSVYAGGSVVYSGSDVEDDAFVIDGVEQKGPSKLLARNCHG